MVSQPAYMLLAPPKPNLCIGVQDTLELASYCTRNTWDVRLALDVHVAVSSLAAAGEKECL